MMLRLPQNKAHRLFTGPNFIITVCLFVTILFAIHAIESACPISDGRSGAGIIPVLCPLMITLRITGKV